MLKEKWRNLLLREKLLLISGILVILSIPFSAITLYCIAASMTIFVIVVSYNICKLIQHMKIVTLQIKAEMQKKEKPEEISLPLPLIIGITIGIPMVFILLIFLWMAI